MCVHGSSLLSCAKIISYFDSLLGNRVICFLIIPHYAQLLSLLWQHTICLSRSPLIMGSYDVVVVVVVAIVLLLRDTCLLEYWCSCAAQGYYRNSLYRFHFALYLPKCFILQFCRKPKGKNITLGHGFEMWCVRIL